MRPLPSAVRSAPDRARLSDGREIPGRPADEADLAAPDLAPELALALGSAIATLAARDGGPTHGWRQAFEARVQQAEQAIRERRLHLGPPLDRAVGPRRWPALDGLDRLGHVHGDLGPHAVWVDDEGRPVAVLGLDAAQPGDPLIDVASLLRLADPALRAIAVEATRLLLGPAELARLEACHRADLLFDLARAPDDPDARALHVERVRLRLDEPPLTARLLSGGPARHEPDHPAVALRRALEASPSVATTDERAAWLGALGASLLSVVAPEAARHRLGLVARELASGLPSGAVDATPGVAEPAFTGLALRGVLMLDEAVGAHVHRGLAVAASVDPALEVVAEGLREALQPATRAVGAPLPVDVLEHLADRLLTGRAAAAPALVWAAQVLSLRGRADRASELLGRADALE